MKKLILSLMLLGGLTFIACSDDDEYTDPRCQVCEIEGGGDYDVCPGKENDFVYAGGVNTGITMKEYFEMNCLNEYVAPGAKPTPAAGTCVTCDAYTLGGVTAPAVTVCVGENGNAVIDDMDTGMKYSDYIAAVEMATDCR